MWILFQPIAHHNPLNDLASSKGTSACHTPICPQPSSFDMAVHTVRVPVAGPPHERLAVGDRFLGVLRPPPATAQLLLAELLGPCNIQGRTQHMRWAHWHRTSWVQQVPTGRVLRANFVQSFRTDARYYFSSEGEGDKAPKNSVG